jgi:hypothetical protein
MTRDLGTRVPVAVLSSRLSPAQTAKVVRRWAVPILLTRDPNVVRSAASVVVVVAAVWCLLRREEFRLGDAVEAVQGGLLDVGVLADHVGGDASSRSLNASEYVNGSRRSACSRSLSPSAT